MAEPRSEVPTEVTVRDFSFGFPCFAACVSTNFRVLQYCSLFLSLCVFYPPLACELQKHCTAWVTYSDLTPPCTTSPIGRPLDVHERVPEVGCRLAACSRRTH